MKVNRYRHLFSIGGQLHTFIRKFYEGKNWNFRRRIFIFVLQIRNKSPFSGKIITSFKIERMSLNSLTIWPKHKIEMQIIYDGRKVQVWEFVFRGLNIGKWSTGKHCDGDAVVRNMKTVLCQKGSTSCVRRKRRPQIVRPTLWVFTLCICALCAVATICPYGRERAAHPCHKWAPGALREGVIRLVGTNTGIEKQITNEPDSATGERKSGNIAGYGTSPCI